MMEDDINKISLNQETFNKRLVNIENEITELEKKLNDPSPFPTIVQHGRDHTKIEGEIEKLEKQMKLIMNKEATYQVNLNRMDKELSELKEQFSNNHLDLFPDWINDISLVKEILRDLLLNVELKGITNVDKGKKRYFVYIIFHHFLPLKDVLWIKALQLTQ